MYLFVTQTSYMGGSGVELPRKVKQMGETLASGQSQPAGRIRCLEKRANNINSSIFGSGRDGQNQPLTIFLIIGSHLVLSASKHV